MTAVVIAMIIIVSLGLAVTAVVAIGMRGKLAGNVPEATTDRLHVIATHLNGEASMPAPLYNAARKVIHRG